MLDKNWVRWILTALSKNFFDNKEYVSLFIQGADRLQGQTQGAEFSTDGPFFKNLQKGLWQIEIDVNILLNVAMDDDDIYKLQKYEGTILQTFKNCIPVYKFGRNPSDDNSYLGKLLLTDKNGQTISVVNYGQLAPDIRIQQAVISGTYQIELRTN